MTEACLRLGFCCGACYPKIRTKMKICLERRHTSKQLAPRLLSQKCPLSMPQCTEKISTLNRLQKTFTMKKVQYQGPRSKQRVSRRHLHAHTRTHVNTDTSLYVCVGINKMFALFALHARHQRCVYVT